MALITSYQLAKALVDLGVITADLNHTERVIIDLQAQAVPVVYVRQVGVAGETDMDKLLVELLTGITPSGAT